MAGDTRGSVRRQIWRECGDAFDRSDVVDARGWSGLTARTMPSVVGRRDELDAIDGFLESIEGGRAPVMLLSGMAGIGKTTLWNAGVGSARDRRYQVVTARPTEVETGLAFASLGDLLTPLLDAPPPDLPGPQREALDAALLRASAASPPQPLGVSLGALHLLRAAAQDAPLLLAIDDVPWLDDASARVLDFSIRRLDADRVGFLLARRAAAPDEPLPAWLTTLPPDRMTRQDVPPLSVDETAALLREHLGLNLSRPVLTRLHAISGGTPFYALELGRDLQRRGGRATPESLAVPRSLEGLVGRPGGGPGPRSRRRGVVRRGVRAADHPRPRSRARHRAPGGRPGGSGVRGRPGVGGRRHPVRPPTPRGRDLQPRDAKPPPGGPRASGRARDRTGGASAAPRQNRRRS